jgi:hypothetical protein
MKGLLQRVPLQHEYARSTDSRWIILNDHCISDAIQDIIDQYIILREFVIAMVGNTNGAPRHEGANVSKGIAQLAITSWIRYSAASLAPRFRLPPPSARASTGARNLPV